MLFYQYLHNNDVKVEFKAIDQPVCDLKDKMDPLKRDWNYENMLLHL